MAAVATATMAPRRVPMGQMLPRPIALNLRAQPIENLGGWIEPEGRISGAGSVFASNVFADVIALGMQESTWSSKKAAKQADKKKKKGAAGDDSDDDSDDDDDEPPPADDGAAAAGDGVAMGELATAPRLADSSEVVVADSSRDGMQSAVAAHLGAGYVTRGNVTRGQMRLLVFVRFRATPKTAAPRDARE